jgi:hypothetical protein
MGVCRNLEGHSGATAARRPRFPYPCVLRTVVPAVCRLLFPAVRTNDPARTIPVTDFADRTITLRHAHLAGAHRPHLPRRHRPRCRWRACRGRAALRRRSGGGVGWAGTGFVAGGPGAGGAGSGGRFGPQRTPALEIRWDAYSFKSRRQGAETSSHEGACAAATDRCERRHGGGAGAAAAGGAGARQADHRVARNARTVQECGRPPSRPWHRSIHRTLAGFPGDVFRTA